MLICAACPGSNNGLDNVNVFRKKFSYLFVCTETQKLYYSIVLDALKVIS
jgi:hypothetical protein